jgi:hypothetical protein
LFRNFSIAFSVLVSQFQLAPDLPSAAEREFRLAYCFGLALDPEQIHPSPSLKKKERSSKLTQPPPGQKQEWELRQLQ